MTYDVQYETWCDECKRAWEIKRHHRDFGAIQKILDDAERQTTPTVREILRRIRNIVG